MSVRSTVGRPSLFALLVVAACGSTAETRVSAPVTTEAAAFERARAEHKGVMLELYATWSGPSEELAHALRDPRVSGPLADRFVPLRVDISQGTDADLALQDRYGARTSPALVFVAPDGTVVGRVSTVLDPAELAAAVTAAGVRIHDVYQNPRR